jgi:hypothetical protein
MPNLSNFNVSAGNDLCFQRSGVKQLDAQKNGLFIFRIRRQRVSIWKICLLDLR